MPVTRLRLSSVGLSTIGCAMVLTATLTSSASGLSQIIIALGALALVLSPVIEWRAHSRGAPRRIGGHPESGGDSRAEFDTWREQVCASLEEQSRQLDHRRQKLNDQLLRYHEFLEYPAIDSAENSSDSPPSNLSERDREVNRILESEAARVYEKIRSDGYRVDGYLDSATIRLEVLDVIQRVARVYSPDSANPIMETSFDQLARAASRVCLQALVLVEQLPLDVQHYTVAELYNYVRGAVRAWGAWQTVSPWMTRLSRGMYAGRIAAGSSPVTFGAWWVATELGRRGSKKLVENYVDQRAVAFFNDAVRLVGNEVACVYGPGIRQRDAAWAYGAELTELHHRFPPSRESLQASLREVTGLPLRSEYDRIYLYRCLAEHKASGLRVTDPMVLTRDERENIAARLEQFFRKYIHGATDADVRRWHTSVEDHLDLRLKLNSDDSVALPTTSPRTALRSIHSFLTAAAGLESAAAFDTLRSSQLWSRLDNDEQQLLSEELTGRAVQGFEPPELDPADPLTSAYLDGLIDCCVRAALFDPSLEALLLETGRYFRQGAEETRRKIADAWMQRLAGRTVPDGPLPRKVSVPARQLLQLLEPHEMIAGIYHDVELKPSTSSVSADSTELRLAVLKGSGRRRLVLLTNEPEAAIIWEATDDNFQTHRVRGLVIDDCELSGGHWADNRSGGRVMLAGQFGTGFETRFAPLLN